MEPRDSIVDPALVEPGTPPEPVTLRTLQRMAAAGEAFACLTCYDATTARWLERAAVAVLLALTAGVKRGAPRTLVMGDMPFMSYQAGEDGALKNAGRFLTEGLADVVKVEADESFAPLIARMTRAGVPVCGHIGSRPQLATLKGGYRAAGRTAEEAAQIVRDAQALEQAGCVLLLIEAVPDEVTERVLAATRTPLIGIGAGSACHGQVLVLQDLLGLTDERPRFAEPSAQLGPVLKRAAEDWVLRVREGRVGGRRYTMARGEAEKLRVKGT